uniref:FXYD domain-containing ion transport regulator n=1 Tax=Takifugu rubripes TaxID=31033 RepID=A0A674PAM6_TAKRU
ASCLQKVSGSERSSYYHTLRVGGLVFAGVVVFLSVLLLAGNKIFNCGKSKVKRTDVIAPPAGRIV